MTAEKANDDSHPSQAPERSLGGAPEWIDVGALARVEVSSEDPDHPIAHALVARHEAGWRAAEPGRQIVRILFDAPHALCRIYLHVVETTRERTQELTLRRAERADGPWEEIVRQQWTFSPTGSTHEIEDYRMPAREVAAVELEIVPDIAGGDARASLQQLRLA
jgi:hypothetical protein